MKNELGVFERYLTTDSITYTNLPTNRIFETDDGIHARDWLGMSFATAIVTWLQSSSLLILAHGREIFAAAIAMVGLA